MTPVQRMKAVVVRQYGSPDVLRVEDLEMPTPRANEVLIKVRAASLNPLDRARMLAGQAATKQCIHLRDPNTPGFFYAQPAQLMGSTPPAAGAPGLFLQWGQVTFLAPSPTLNLFKLLVNIGDAKSLACHPASTTHRQMSLDELRKAGVRPETIRLSIGIEHVDDIIADLDQALAATTKSAARRPSFAAKMKRPAQRSPSRE